MDHIWTGRMLMRASPALQQRFLENARQVGPGAPCVGAIAGELLRQVGLAVLVQEADHRRPLARTRGTLRFSNEMTGTEVAVAFNALMDLTSQYLRNLPGVPEEVERQVRRALRHAGTTSLQILHALLTGEPGPDIERAFGGAPVLVFAAREPALAVAG